MNQLVRIDTKEYLTALLEGARPGSSPGLALRADRKGPLGPHDRTQRRQVHPRALPRSNAWMMIERRRAATSIDTKIGNNSFRSTGIKAV